MVGAGTITPSTNFSRDNLCVAIKEEIILNACYMEKIPLKLLLIKINYFAYFMAPQFLKTLRFKNVTSQF